jgi:hypothetical protein
VIYHAFLCTPAFCVSEWLRGGCGFGLKRRLVNRGIELVHGLLVPAWNQMPIAVHRDLNRGVAELFLHVDWALSLLKEQRGEAVSEIMEAHPTEPGLLEQPVKEAVADVIRIEESAVFVTEDPWGHGLPVARHLFELPVDL